MSFTLSPFAPLVCVCTYSRLGLRIYTQEEATLYTQASNSLHPRLLFSSPAPLSINFCQVPWVSFLLGGPQALPHAASVAFQTVGSATHQQACPSVSHKGLLWHEVDRSVGEPPRLAVRCFRAALTLSTGLHCMGIWIFYLHFKVESHKFHLKLSLISFK